MTVHGSHVSGGKKSGLVVRLIRTVYLTVTAPLRAFQAVRQAMTPASVSLLLFGIVTLNIIWGFPWTGIFSACVGMFVVGCMIHFITLPSLNSSYSLPSSAPKGQPFRVTIHAKNQSVLPALDFGLSFAQPVVRRKRWLRRHSNQPIAYTVQQNPKQSLLLGSGDSATVNAALTYHRRGIHTLPDTVINGSFPFHLFESQIATPSQGSIAITPQPLTNDGAHSKGLLDNLGGWSHKLLSGDQLDYTGSREYEAGMPVRRWDFPSWARLGVPIVREFQSPSIQTVFLIIDTGLEEHTETNHLGEYPAFEQMLSLATTAIHELTKQTVKIQLFVTEAKHANIESTGEYLSDTDPESMLIKLASAGPIDANSADKQMRSAVDIAERSPVLILTTRGLPDVQKNARKSCTVMRTDTRETPKKTSQPKRQRRTVPPQTQPV